MILEVELKPYTVLWKVRNHGVSGVGAIHHSFTGLSSCFAAYQNRKKLLSRRQEVYRRVSRHLDTSLGKRSGGYVEIKFLLLNKEFILRGSSPPTSI